MTALIFCFRKNEPQNQDIAQCGSGVRIQNHISANAKIRPRPNRTPEIFLAPDADLDYSLALYLAAEKRERQPPGLDSYGDKARGVASDIMEKEELRLPSGEFLPRPWVLDDEEKEQIQNVLRSIAEDSKRHRKMVEELREKVEKEDRDVY
ncbi:MAG: hypothetical protein KGZ25_10730 [Planctomycetes bacterium]|nr:hypothetical protein [Planctomycetota bacterium]